MTLRLANRFIVLVGMGLLLAACNTDDNIADGSDGGAGTGGAAGSGGSAGSSGTGGATGGSGGSVGPDAGPCEDACPSADATMCMGNRLITCAQSYTGCLAWQAGDFCPTGQSCNSDGTRCITPQSDCSTDADCGCGCGCIGNQCECTGAIPPSCNSDADCGPSCYGLACISGECQPRVNPDCVNPCQVAGAKRCAANAIQQCEDVGGGCLQWGSATPCPQDQVCDSTGTQCLATPGQCTSNSDCGCGCGCIANECKCTGGVPPSCTSDADCGPACSGLVCVAGECVQSGAPDAGVCVDPCSNAGDTRCVGAEIQTCVDVGSGCLHWGPQTACPSGQSCNSDGTTCVASPSACSTDVDCGCGCGCYAGQCYCTGAIPPTCASDADCGPACAGFVCLAGQCVQL